MSGLSAYATRMRLRTRSQAIFTDATTIVSYRARKHVTTDETPRRCQVMGLGVGDLESPAMPCQCIVQASSMCSWVHSSLIDAIPAHHELLEGGGAVERLAQVGDAANVERVGRGAGARRRGDLRRRTEGSGEGLGLEVVSTLAFGPGTNVAAIGTC